jgi:alpha-glucosidase
MTSTRIELPGTAADSAAPWWRNSVIYQLYVRSFADSDGDGIGDLDGITARLDHIAGLGVDGLWLNPCYPSPNRDGGYDVADYFDIDRRYGGLPAFQRLLDGAHARGLKLLMDLVPNHCSDQHAWFQAAVASVPGSTERARFVFREGRGADGELPPNNWRSVFGGPAWTRLTSPDGTPEQWYLHSFDASQPDFDWENEDVAAMFDAVLTAWFDRGIDGFRIDVAYAMVKHPGLPDVDDPAGENPYQWNQPGVHAIFRRWRQIAERYDRDLTLVGEVWLPPIDVASYVREGELCQVFYFDLLQQPFTAEAFRTSIASSLDGLAGLGQGAGVPTWTLNSHDVHRSVSRYGLVQPEPLTTADLNATRTRARGGVDLAIGAARARAALLLTLALPGSVYLYQGEELGLPEFQDIPDDARRDPIWERSGRTEHGRDGSRVPLPWSAGSTSFGFSPPGALQPWLPQPEWFAQFAADGQDDPQSMLAFYRLALGARPAIDPASALEWLETGRDDVLAFRRAGTVSVTVFAGQPYCPPPEWGGLVLRSDLGALDAALPANSTGWLLHQA